MLSEFAQTPQDSVPCPDLGAARCKGMLRYNSMLTTLHPMCRCSKLHLKMEAPAALRAHFHGGNLLMMCYLDRLRTKTTLMRLNDVASARAEALCQAAERVLLDPADYAQYQHTCGYAWWRQLADYGISTGAPSALSSRTTEQRMSLTVPCNVSGHGITKQRFCRTGSCTPLLRRAHSIAACCACVAAALLTS